MITINAVGMSCPEPLLMLKNTLKTEQNVLLLLDSKGAHDNCINYAQKQGFTTKTTEKNGSYSIVITKA